MNEDRVNTLHLMVYHGSSFRDLIKAETDLQTAGLHTSADNATHQTNREKVRWLVSSLHVLPYIAVEIFLLTLFCDLLMYVVTHMVCVNIVCVNGHVFDFSSNTICRICMKFCHNHRLRLSSRILNLPFNLCKI